MNVLRPSLVRRITAGFVISHCLAALLFLLLLYPAAVGDTDEPIGPKLPIMLLERDLVRSQQGRLVLREDANVRAVASRNEGLWFVASAGAEVFRFGPVPALIPQQAAISGPQLSSGRYTNVGRADRAGDAMIDEVETDAGMVVVTAGGVESSSLTFADYLLFLGATNNLLLPLIATAFAMLGAFVTIPVVLRALRPTADAAAHLDPSDLTSRVPEQGVVKELLPIIRAFNSALDRLGEAFERRRRLIADVAHELRTPLAVINLHVDSLDAIDAKHDLQRGVYRLSQMVGQMLDVERLVESGRRRERVDLVELARAAVADIAPLTLAQGYDIAVDAVPSPVVVKGDRHSLSRALSNLLGNAIAHGGNRGTITVRVAADRSIEVADEGPGIAAEAHDRVFEPFHRERWDKDGCGLGLHLVREIMTAHGGTVNLASTESGAHFKLNFA